MSQPQEEVKPEGWERVEALGQLVGLVPQWFPIGKQRISPQRD
jgi:hypothetical protein